MAITTRRTARLSQESSITTSSEEANDQTYINASTLQVATGPMDTGGGDGATALATVNAIAAGTATVATGDVAVSVNTSGSVSAGSASAEVSATAASAGDTTAFAAADTSATLSGLSGAGFSLEWDSMTLSQDEEGSVWTATSRETLHIVETTPSGHAGGDDTSPGEPPSGSALPEPETFDETSDWDWDGDTDFELEGNAVYFSTDAEALGTDTFVAVDVMALVVEDELSLLDLYALAISG